MELIKQIKLFYQEGSSDKVYEIYLYQSAPDHYLVNFRYGRRGSQLKEDTKTTQPVSLAEATSIFEKLANSKIKKGYQEITETKTSETETTPFIKANSREEAILNYLSGQDSRNWKLDRIIWRAGVLKIKDATPLLINLLGTGEPLRDYCIIWSLGWCGNQETIPLLVNLQNQDNTPDFIKRIAFEAQLKLSDSTQKQQLQAEKINQLSPELQTLVQNGSVEELAKSVANYITNGTYEQASILDIFYQIDNQYTRPVLKEYLTNIPLKPGYFKAVRHIFKRAEYRQDAEILAILTYRFEKQAPHYRDSNWYVRLPDGTYLHKHQYQYNSTTRRYEVVGSPVKEEKESPNSRLAYGTNTRDYLIRRIWRALQQLGEENDPNYVKIAAEILLQYSDQDAVPAKTSHIYRWHLIDSQWQKVTYQKSWDIYANYLTFNHILYENSPRYLLNNHSQAWRCQDHYKPGDPTPDIREEAFPQVWQQQPEMLLRLLLESNCKPVHEFAIKALETCPEFCQEINLDILIKLINKPYEITAKFAFGLVRKFYNLADPNLELIVALANCIYQPARQQSHQWIEDQKYSLVKSGDLIFKLATSSYQDTRQCLQKILTNAILSEDQIKIFIGRLITYLLSLDPSQTEIGQDLNNIILIFSQEVRKIGFNLILDLIEHSLSTNQILGASLLLNHEISADQLPLELIQSLINSSSPEVRKIGIEIFGKLPDQRLLESYALLVTMITHELSDLRQQIRPVIQRLSHYNQAFASQLILELIEVLVKSEKYEGLHQDLITLIQETIPNWQSYFTEKIVLRMLKSKSSVSQDLGANILYQNSHNWHDQFSTSDLVKLASHDLLLVRQASWQMFADNLPNYRNNQSEKLAAIRILESTWEDSKTFASEILQQQFTAEDWTPEVLICLCDSTKADVRKIGQELVNRYFQEAYGQEYLLKFSEHPSADIQLFATNFLEEYASNNPERLQELSPYFITVLSQVNRGRIAKEKVFNFLAIEAQKSEQAANIVAEILTRQSLTIAIGDKAKSIKTMVKIKQQYPHLSVPIQIKTVTEVRN